MDVRVLDVAKVAKWQVQALTYPEVGATQSKLPEGYSSFSRSSTLASPDFEKAARALLSWQVQLRSGLRVAASSSTVAEGAVVEMRLGVGPFAVAAPCRVVYVIDEENRRGFAYGTLPGHPESGEESFVLHRQADGEIAFSVTAFSRPSSPLARVAGSLGRAVQHAMTTRYLGALDRDAS